MNVDIPIDIDIVIAGKMYIVLRFVLVQDKGGLTWLQLDLRADKYFCKIAINISFFLNLLNVLSDP